MPWHKKSMKDVTSCDKLRWAAHKRYQPQISEWGNPDEVMLIYSSLNKIGEVETTRRTETSKYPEEKKSTEIALVAASERVRA